MPCRVLLCWYLQNKRFRTNHRRGVAADCWWRSHVFSSPIGFQCPAGSGKEEFQQWDLRETLQSVFKLFTAKAFELFAIILLLRLHPFDVTSIIDSEALLSYEPSDFQGQFSHNECSVLTTSTTDVYLIMCRNLSCEGLPPLDIC